MTQFPLRNRKTRNRRPEPPRRTFRTFEPEPGPNIRNGKQARNRRTEHPTERKKEKRREIPPIRWLHPPPCSSYGTRFLDDSCCLIIKHAAHFFLTSSMASLPDKCSISNRRTSMCDSPFSNSFCNPASSPGLYRAPNKDAAYILSLSDPMI